MEFWLTKWVNPWTRICTDDWVTDLTPSQQCWLCWCITNQPWILLIWGIALNSGWSPPGFTSSRCDSRYSPPARLPVEWQILKIRESLVLDSHRPLLADGSNWNITLGMQVFPALTAGGVVCVCVEAILNCTQTATSDWWAQGRFTPAQQTKHFFFLNNVVLYSSEKSCGGRAGPRALNGTSRTGT